MWIQRKEIIFRKKIYTNLSTLIEEAKNKEICTSLATFKPKVIKKFVIEKTQREWNQEKLKKLKEKAKQTSLFEKAENPFDVVRKVPYKFSYTFLDDENKESTLMIEDWEICQLYWNSLKRHDGNEVKACNDVKKKYYEKKIFA